jgi:hypothetical protein
VERRQDFAERSFAPGRRFANELAHLFRALKALAAARALPKLAESARVEEWSVEHFVLAGTVPGIVS